MIEQQDKKENTHIIQEEIGFINHNHRNHNSGQFSQSQQSQNHLQSHSSPQSDMCSSSHLNLLFNKGVLPTSLAQNSLNSESENNQLQESHNQINQFQQPMQSLFDHAHVTDAATLFARQEDIYSINQHRLHDDEDDLINFDHLCSPEQLINMARIPRNNDSLVCYESYQKHDSNNYQDNLCISSLYHNERQTIEQNPHQILNYYSEQPYEQQERINNQQTISTHSQHLPSYNYDLFNGNNQINNSNVIINHMAENNRLHNTCDFDQDCLLLDENEIDQRVSIQSTPPAIKNGATLSAYSSEASSSSSSNRMVIPSRNHQNPLHLNQISHLTPKKIDLQLYLPPEENTPVKNQGYHKENIPSNQVLKKRKARISEEESKANNEEERKYSPSSARVITSGYAFEDEMEQCNITSKCYLGPSDILIDLNWFSDPEKGQNSLAIESKETVDFQNGKLNAWKKCTAIEKDTSENGCYYLSIDSRISAQTPLQVIREAFDNLERTKQDAHQESKFLSTERILEGLESKELRKRTMVNFSTEEVQMIEGKYPQCLKKVKTIMRELVNANGSNKSFVFASVKALNPSTIQQEITQMIYSPKLISILYGIKNAQEVFYAQVMRHGIIDFFDSSGQIILNSFELSQNAGLFRSVSSSVDGFSPNQHSSQTNGTSLAKKASLMLFTSDNFQIPITVTLKRFNLLQIVQQDEMLVSSTSNQNRNVHLQNHNNNLNSEETHILNLFDIKIKIKYQKQLKKYRENATRSNLYPNLIVNDKLFKIKSIQDDGDDQLQFNKMDEEEDLLENDEDGLIGPTILTNQNPIIQTSNQYLGIFQSSLKKTPKLQGYFQESLSFLKRFYPDKIIKTNKKSIPYETQEIEAKIQIEPV